MGIFLFCKRFNERYAYKFYTFEKPDYPPMVLDQNADVTYIKLAAYFFKSNEILGRSNVCNKLSVSGLFWLWKYFCLLMKSRRKCIYNFGEEIILG